MRRRYRTSWVRRFKAKHRRSALRNAGLCINNSAHGKATHGVLCEACREQHRRSQ